MKKLIFVFFGMVLLITLFGGCATYHKRKFDVSSHPRVKTIGVLEPGYLSSGTPKNLIQTDTDLRYLVHGLLWATAHIYDIRSKSNMFKKKLEDFRLTSELQAALVAELRKSGYAVKELKTPRKEAGFFKKYKSLEKTDAYLDLIFSYAGYARYSATSFSKSDRLFLPRLWCRVRLINQSNDVLYDFNISYWGKVFIKAWGTSIRSDPKYNFNSFDEIISDPDRAIEGLRVGLSLIAKRIAQDLSEGKPVAETETETEKEL